MSEARNIERAGLVVMSAARDARQATNEMDEARKQLDWAVDRLRNERIKWEEVESRLAALSEPRS